jgi:hypothetical protein
VRARTPPWRLHFTGADELRLLRPAAIDTGETPLDAAARRPYRSTSNDDEHRVGVARGQDTDGDPGTSINPDVVKDDVAYLAVGLDFASCGGLPLTTTSTGTDRVAPIRARSMCQ